MKANKKHREKFVRDRKGFTFIVPMTMAIVVGFALLVLGAYVVGTLGSAFEDTYATNVKSGTADTTYTHAATTDSYRNITLPGTVGDLDSTLTNFYIKANGTHNIYYNMSINGNIVNNTSQLLAGTNKCGWNITLATLISNGNVTTAEVYLNYSWDVNSSENTITIRYVSSHFLDSDYRSDNENKTVFLLGNVTDGFSDVVDIEIVVIIITALSMAIIAIIAIGSRRQLF